MSATRALYRCNAPNFEHWKDFSTLEIWKVAAMMHGFDPRAWGDVSDEHGNSVDLSHEREMLFSAVRSGRIVACPSTSSPDDRTHIDVAPLLPWLRLYGFSSLADGLDHGQAGQSAVPLLSEPERRLAALRGLGGNDKYTPSRGWRFTGISKLVAAEVSAGHTRVDEKTIRKDLVEAAEAERAAARAGHHINQLVK